jgi:hypothetical protein
MKSHDKALFFRIQAQTALPSRKFPQLAGLAAR